jgi:hypothetical protein
VSIRRLGESRCFHLGVLTPEEQEPEAVLGRLRPLLDELYLALERAAARTDEWFVAGQHLNDPYFRAMMIRYLAREHLQRWERSLRMTDFEDRVEVRRPSNVGLHIVWADQYVVRVRMGEDGALPVPVTGAAVDFFNQPLLGMEMPYLRLFVVWSRQSTGIDMQVACPAAAKPRKKDTVEVAWRRPVQHPADLVAASVTSVPPAEVEYDVPWELIDEEPVAETGEEPPR